MHNNQKVEVIKREKKTLAFLAVAADFCGPLTSSREGAGVFFSMIGHIINNYFKDELNIIYYKPKKLVLNRKSKAVFGRESCSKHVKQGGSLAHD